MRTRRMHWRLVSAVNFGYNDVPLGKQKGRYMRSVTISEVHILWHYVYMYVWMLNFVYVLCA